jgi:serine phosphatase RsbU (regulator of sigma subunit)
MFKFISLNSLGEVSADQTSILRRYRRLMITIGILYPIWRFIAYYFDQSANESWALRGTIGVVFLVISALTFRFPYFSKNVGTYFNIITYIWFIQTFYLLIVNEMETDYLILTLVVIFVAGASFLETKAMLWYYLMVLVLTGSTIAMKPDGARITFFFAIVTALSVSHVGLQSLLGMFRDLHESHLLLQKRTDEFTELASAVQTLFLPSKEAEKNENWNLSGFYRAVDGCGGGWWSYFEHEKKLTIIVGDVTGHGPGPAMMTASIASYTRCLQTERPDLSLQNILRALNKYLLELQSDKSGKHRYLMTVLALEIDFNSKTVKSLSAGAPPALILNKNEKARFIGVAGNPLGMTHDLKIGEEESTFKAGDRFLIHTDGIVEIIVNGRPLSESRMLKLISQDLNIEPEQATRSLVAHLDKMRGERIQEDDYTLVMVDVA